MNYIVNFKLLLLYIKKKKMKSIFDLKTKNSELSSANQGLSNYKYQEVQSLRSIVGNKFPDGEIVYRWTYGSSKYWLPNKSYLKIRISITNPDGSRLPRNKNIAWGMNTAPLLFQSSSYKIADQTVCSITQNLPQIDSLKNRMYKSKSWLSSIGNSNNNWDHSYRNREEGMYSSGGNEINGGLNPFLTWVQVAAPGGLSSVGLISTDTVEIVLNSTNGGNGTYLLSLADTASPASGHKWSNLGLKVGDVIIYTLPVTTLSVENIVKSSGIITGITDLTLTFVSSSNVIPLTSSTIGTNRINISFSRHDFYDENNSTNSQEIELIWYPTLAIFDSVKHAIPCAATKHEFTLTPYPESVYQKNIIESRGSDKNNIVSTDSDIVNDIDNYKIEIKDMRFYILTCDSNRIEDTFKFMLDLNEIQCQSTPITSTQQQQSLDVIPSTNGISMAFQDSGCLTNTLYPMSKFKIRDNLELKLKRYYIRYEGQVPQPDYEGELVLIGDGNTSSNDIGYRDLLKDSYNRTMVYNGQIFMENPPTIEEYRSKGFYVYHPFPKTASSKNTRVYVQVNFSTLTDSTGTQTEPFLLLFSHYKKAVVLDVRNGRIVSVSPYNA